MYQIKCLPHNQSSVSLPFEISVHDGMGFSREKTTESRHLPIGRFQLSTAQRGPSLGPTSRPLGLLGPLPVAGSLPSPHALVQRRDRAGLWRLAAGVTGCQVGTSQRVILTINKQIVRLDWIRLDQIRSNDRLFI